MKEITKAILVSMFYMLMTTASQAQDDAKNIHIHSLDPNVDVTKFGGNYTKHPYQAHKKTTTLPNVKKRDEAFVNANLSTETQNMDHLDKDLLYLRAKKYPLKKLTETYPNIPSGKLEKLKKEVEQKK